MKKAFIFDMDGVIVDSENAWLPFEDALLIRLLGKETRQKIGGTVGVSMEGVYDQAKEAGSLVEWREFRKEYDDVASKVYNSVLITPGTDDLLGFLATHSFAIGVVSASPIDRVNLVLPRLLNGDKINKIISLDENPNFKHKPSPDGYNEMMRQLGSKPENTIILEDSNLGIESAKKSGAYTIALAYNLLPGYKQEGADVYAQTMLDVIKLIKEQRKDLLS